MTLSVKEKFDKAAKYIQNLPKDGPYKPTQDTQLKYYALYKQGTVGDVNIARPGLLDFVGKAKWDAWNGVKGTSQEDAQQQYVAFIIEDLGANALKKSDGSDDSEVKLLIQELKE